MIHSEGMINASAKTVLGPSSSFLQGLASISNLFVHNEIVLFKTM